MSARLPLGTSDFAQLRADGLTYVDKTGLVVDLVRSARQVVLLPRPRRFGKTLNLTMLRAFFERDAGDRAPLFADLEVVRKGEEVLEHLGRHPTLFLSFKDVRQTGWEGCLEQIRDALGEEIARHEPVWSSAPAGPARARLAELRRGEGSPVAWGQALRWLTEALARATGERAVVLIDEYDTPVHAGYSHGYYDEVVSFLRTLLGAGLKDNPHLYRGVLTGVLRVARESMFSGLNNVSVHTALSAPFAQHFGFTDAEVDALCALTGATARREAIRDWYDGYQFGAHRIYNPWSVLSYLSSPDDGLRPYWVNTASDEILRELLVGSGLGVHEELSALLRGEPIRQPLNEEIVLRELRRDPGTLWSFLLAAGYLTPEAPLSRGADGAPDSPLRVPNREVAHIYRTIFSGWLRRALPASSEAPALLARALLGGDEETVHALLSRLLLETLSHHDTGGRQPEAIYQAFIVGLLVLLEPTHDVRSNRESGHGRYDIMLRPRQRGQAGAVLELKLLDAERGETPERALERALAQIRTRDYAAELRAAGASPVQSWAVVFEGRRAWVRREGSGGA